MFSRFFDPFWTPPVETVLEYQQLVRVHPIEYLLRLKWTDSEGITDVSCYACGKKLARFFMIRKDVKGIMLYHTVSAIHGISCPRESTDG